MRNSQIKIFLFSILIIGSLINNTIMFPAIFAYFDEFVALLFFPYFLLNIANRKKIFSYGLVFFIIVFVFVGFLGSTIYKFQTFDSVIIDSFACVKFFMILYFSLSLIKNQSDVYCLKRALIPILKIYILICLLLTILVYFGVYDGAAGYRYGLVSIRLFYNHPTYFSASMFGAILIITLLMNKKTDFVFILIGILLIISTLRTKAFIAVGFFLIFAIFFNNKLKKFKFIPFVVIVIITLSVLFIGYDTYEFYFLGDYNARQALFQTGIKIMSDRFPIGYGFSTFGSSESAKHYSVIYFIYGIDNVYGISEQYSSFISDSFWPMIMGQFGIIGLISFIMILYLIFKKYVLVTRTNFHCIIASITAFFYLLVSSSSESAYVNSLSVIFAIIIGLSFGYNSIEIGVNENDT